MEFIGTFIWNEMMTSNLAATKAFYAKVAGWTFNDMTMQDGSVYTVANTPGRTDGVAGMMEWPADQAGANDWMPYLGVADAAATVKAVREAGGTVIRDVMAVPTVGKIAVVADTTGTVMGILEPEPRM